MDKEEVRVFARSATDAVRRMQRRLEEVADGDATADRVAHVLADLEKNLAPSLRAILDRAQGEGALAERAQGHAFPHLLNDFSAEPSKSLVPLAATAAAQSARRLEMILTTATLAPPAAAGTRSALPTNLLRARTELVLLETALRALLDAAGHRTPSPDPLAARRLAHGARTALAAGAPDAAAASMAWALERAGAPPQWRDALSQPHPWGTLVILAFMDELEGWILNHAALPSP
ncbi:MAG: hypothetical protein ACYDDF_04300 [Thermoplasmatota archaeon]